MFASRAPRSSAPILLALAALAAACSSSEETGPSPTGPPPDGGGGGSGGSGGAAGCTFKATPWTAGTQAFREATADWGIEGVLAVKVSVIDLDGDGWPDLFARNGGGPDEFGPEGKRARWLLRNNGKHGFEDVTEASGVTAVRNPANAATGRPSDVMAIADADNDGDQDIFMAKAITNTDDTEQETSELMLNLGKGKFALGPEKSEARGVGKPAMPVGVTFSDVDRDGNVDLFISHNMLPGAYSPLQDRLYLGHGDGTFTDRTFELGLKTKNWSSIKDLNAAKGHSWGWGATACDLNNDNLPELLSASYGRAPNHLWQNTGAPGEILFLNRSVESGYAYDQRQDWTDNLNAQCYCHDNPEAEDCDKVTETPSDQFCQALWEGFGGFYRWDHDYDREPWRLGGNSATTTCADVDNDGFMDLMTGEIVHSDVGSSSDPAELMFNTGETDVRFDRPGNETTGLVRDRPSQWWNDGDMNNAVFDFDGDGWLDVYISSSDYPGTRGLLFHQREPRRFDPVSLEDGIDHRRSAGAVAVDLDRDGDLDLVVGNARMRCEGASGADCYPTTQLRIFENLLGGKNHWLELRLEGTGGSNRAAVGARVTVEACGLRQSREVDGGHGQVGTQEDMVLYFGLGQQDEAEVTVRWPDAAGTTQSFTVAADAFYFLRQGGEPKTIKLP